jgi:hypothetical protein
MQESNSRENIYSPNDTETFDIDSEVICYCPANGYSFREIGRDGRDRTGSGSGPLEGSCEHGDVP